MNNGDMSRFAESTANHLSSILPIVEMRTNRGSKYKQTNYYQIRIKPTDKDQPLDSILTTLSSELSAFADVSINKRSVNSGKYSSVSFKHNDKNFDIVVARGINKGESFEKELLTKLQTSLVSEKDPLAESALAALNKIDPTISVDNISSIVARAGKTTRSADVALEDTGSIIADIIFEMKDHSRKFVSVKNNNGTTVSNFGIANAFTEDLIIDTASKEFAQWIKPFNLDIAKIEKGLSIVKSGSAEELDDVENCSIDATDDIKHLMKRMFGCNYLYLRESQDGFKAMNITEQFLEETLLRNLKVTQVRYPSKNRKQVSIVLDSDNSKFLIEIRNTSGGIRPSQMNMRILKTNY